MISGGIEFCHSSICADHHDWVHGAGKAGEEEEEVEEKEEDVEVEEEVRVG